MPDNKPLTAAELAEIRENAKRNAENISTYRVTENGVEFNYQTTRIIPRLLDEIERLRSCLKECLRAFEKEHEAKTPCGTPYCLHCGAVRNHDGNIYHFETSEDGQSCFGARLQEMIKKGESDER